MSKKASNLIKTIAWCVVVVLAVYYLVCAFTTRNLVATAIAAFLGIHRGQNICNGPYSRDLSQPRRDRGDVLRQA